jgi:hypothetical protein
MTEPKISNARPVYRVGDRVEVIETGEPMIVYGTDDDGLWIKCQSESGRFREAYYYNEIGWRTARSSR